MTLLALAHGHRKGRIGIQDGPNGFGGEEGHIHRGEEHPVALVQKVAQADLHGVEHLGGLIILISQENDAVAGQMPLQHGGVVAGDHDELAHSRLGQGGHHPLGHGNGADGQHGLEFSHPLGHACGHDQCADLHGRSLLQISIKSKL